MKQFLMALPAIFFLTSTAYAADPWPGEDLVHMSAELDALRPSLEPSGMVWHPGIEQFVVVGDEGDICLMDQDGSSSSCTLPVYYDLEGVTYADSSSSLIYLAHELVYRSTTDYDISIREYDLDLQNYTGKYWDLSGSMPAADGYGMEGLTFVPNGYHPYADSASGGVFYAGSQYDGKIYAFDVDIDHSGSVSFLGSITPHAGYTDLADLFFSEDTGLVYAMYDANDRLVELNSSGTEVVRYELPGSDQEAVSVVISSCADGLATVYVGQDIGSIYESENYPVTCEESDTVIDVDGDGVDSEADCNDNDASVSTEASYYIDTDVDGYGSSTTTLICASTAPAGYSSLTGDCNDSSSGVKPGATEVCDSIDNDCDGSIDEGLATTTFYRDADGDGYGTSATSTSSCAAVSGYVTNSTDCSDSDGSVHSNITYYRDADGDGLGSATVTTSVCSSTAPSGYVTNNSDTNDSGTSTSRIEFSGNGVDDDGDGVIDEVNTVAENGYDTTYSSTSPSSTSRYRSYVRSIAGSTNGAILVTYADNAVYSYTIFSVTTSTNTTVSSWRSTGYLIVYHPTRRQYAVVNVYTGSVYYTVNY